MRASSEPNGGIAIALGPIAALIAAGSLSKFRDGAGAANVALVLACVVAAAALAGRIAGAATAVTAALAYNFFHTVPYNSLRIHALRDVVTVLLLAAIGLAASELSAWRRRAQAASKRLLYGARTMETTAAMLATGADSDAIWAEIEGALVEALHLAECRFEPGSTPPLPLLPRSGSIVASSMRFTFGGFELPESGASIAVEYVGTTLGHIVIVPDRSAGTSLDARQVAVALADQFAVALSVNDRHRR